LCFIFYITHKRKKKYSDPSLKLGSVFLFFIFLRFCVKKIRTRVSNSSLTKYAKVRKEMTSFIYLFFSFTKIKKISAYLMALSGALCGAWTKVQFTYGPCQCFIVMVGAMFRCWLHFVAPVFVFDRYNTWLPVFGCYRV
jgi:hypothetical protein